MILDDRHELTNVGEVPRMVQPPVGDVANQNKLLIGGRRRVVLNADLAVWSCLWISRLERLVDLPLGLGQEKGHVLHVGFDAVSGGDPIW